MIGMIFGRLTVLHRAPPRNKRTMFMCQCKCGAKVAVRRDALKRGDKISCGCLHYAGGRDIQEAWQACLANRIVTANGCWEYGGARNNKGYGRCMYGQKEVSVHRLSAAINLHLDLESGIQALHRCDNPPCFNPEHLFTGTQSDNVRDCVKKGRQKEIKKTHCPQGHPYRGANLRIRNNGKRVCRTCANERLRRIYHLKNPKASSVGPRAVYV